MLVIALLWYKMQWPKYHEYSIYQSQAQYYKMLKQYKNTHAHWPIGEKLQWLSELISYDNALSCHKWLEQGLEWEDKNII